MKVAKWQAKIAKLIFGKSVLLSWKRLVCNAVLAPQMALKKWQPIFHLRLILGYCYILVSCWSFFVQVHFFNHQNYTNLKTLQMTGTKWQIFTTLFCQLSAAAVNWRQFESFPGKKKDPKQNHFVDNNFQREITLSISIIVLGVLDIWQEN